MMKADIHLSAHSRLPPEAILKAARDFSEHRPELWPGIDPTIYRVLNRDGRSADAVEGSDVFGGIWAREHYEWSGDRVHADVHDSNVFRPGSSWELRAIPTPDGGSTVEWFAHRKAQGMKGTIVVLLLKLFGRRIHGRTLQTTLDILEEKTPVSKEA